MRYPNVLFFRHQKYKDIDAYLEKHDDSIECTLNITNNVHDLNRLYSPNYHLLVTYGDSEKEYIQDIYHELPERFSCRWIHFTAITDIAKFVNGINYCYIHNVVTNHIRNRPIFSIFTTTFNSYHKIIRCYESIRNQTMKDWEWIIIDDSPDDQHFDFLRKSLDHEHRIRMFRKSKNSGSIGDVKNEAVSLCRGSYLLEMDHDDEIVPECLQNAVTVFEHDKQVGFVYMDFINMYEDGKNFFYDSDIISLGYTSYYLQKFRDQWRYVYITANINNISMSHLVACPNHPRIWRRETLLQIGNYSEFLPICDDYEILLRTAISTKCVKIPKIGYIQYMNAENNNFSLIRNREINRLGPEYISPIFYEHYKVHDMMKAMNAFEDVSLRNIPVWRRDQDQDQDKYSYKFCNQVMNLDYIKQFAIIGLHEFYKNMSYIQSLYNSRQENKYDFILLESNYNHAYLTECLDHCHFDEMKCANINHASYHELASFFHTLYKSTSAWEIIGDSTSFFSAEERSSGINPGNVQTLEVARSLLQYHPTLNSRVDVLHTFSTPHHKYLEIGVEYGHTFCHTHFITKVGVDPDPKVESTEAKNILSFTSDDFFKNNKDTFDIIFIDGLHQLEFVVRDFNHSIRALNKLSETACIYLDDILPLHEREQYKIPIKHYYEKGILKYGEPWTGDVWKVLYYLLLHNHHSFEIQYYQNSNYRGIARLKIIDFEYQIPESKIDFINAFSYHTDFVSYLEALRKGSSDEKRI